MYKNTFRSSLLLIFILLTLTHTGRSQGIYGQALKDVNGKDIALQHYAGKKILFIVLSPKTADSLSREIRAFKKQYGNTVHVIGVLSAEDGVTEATKPGLLRSLSINDIELTGIQHTRKGIGQSPVLQWLTNRKQNGHFDREVTSPGQKFFVSENGKLYAVIGPEKHLDAPIIAKIVKTTVN